MLPPDLDIGHLGWQDESWEERAKRPRARRVRRSSSFSSLESLRNINTAGDVIRAAGYPLEEHTVTTSDGYIQQMERIPRHGESMIFLQASMPDYVGRLCRQCHMSTCPTFVYKG